MTPEEYKEKWWNSAFIIGDKFTLIEDDNSKTEVETKTTAWTIGKNPKQFVLVGIKDRHGAVDVDRLTPITKPRREAGA